MYFVTVSGAWTERLGKPSRDQAELQEAGKGVAPRPAERPCKERRGTEKIHGNSRGI